ncbi:asparagine synthetase B [candidate division KSB1 bacterium]
MLKKALVIISLFYSVLIYPQKILIPMDIAQTDHLKAYGVAYFTLEKELNVQWLLNYRGGSFLTDYNGVIERELRLRGVTYELADAARVASIFNEIDQSNMEIVLLEKAPAVAVYAPPNFQPWDDAVALALAYAEIKYDVVWDPDVLTGKLDEYDWLHLHHEDFTGQFGKFYTSYGQTDWYIKNQLIQEETAGNLGFSKVSELKLEIAKKVKEYVTRGGFLFAMCSATDSYDIALAAENTDICSEIFDGDPADPGCQDKLDYSRTFAFENFILERNPYVYEYSDIDIPPSNAPVLPGPENDFFTLFDFSAKYDPVPAMLTQCHTNVIKGFMGQTTSFRRSRIKKNVIIMGETEETEKVKYIHGNFGKGTFTFYGGHDPEDYTHFINDPPTQLSLHKNSPGYRLILNNVLFPAAKKKKRKT